MIIHSKMCCFLIYPAGNHVKKSFVSFLINYFIITKEIENKNVIFDLIF